jgi:acetyltransferase-like isoleucine patch superfamily enzyme
MKIIKKIKNKFRSQKVTESFFTKDIFRNKNFSIGDYTYGKPTILFENDKTNLIIGNFCSIAANVTIFLGGNHRIDWITTYPFNELNNYFPDAYFVKGHPSSKGDVIIGNDVWIGRNVVIMSGITIGDGAVIAAGALVSKSIGDYEVWGGNPATFIKKRFDDDKIKDLKILKWWDWDINKIKNNIPNLCSDDVSALISKEKR